MLKIRRSRDRLIFNMGIPIPEKDSLYTEMGPWCHQDWDDDKNAAFLVHTFSDVKFLLLDTQNATQDSRRTHQPFLMTPFCYRKFYEITNTTEIPKKTQITYHFA